MISTDSYKTKLRHNNALLYQDWVVKYLEEILNDPAKASSSKGAALENFLKFPPQEEIFFGKILENLHNSRDVRRLDSLIKIYGFQRVLFTEPYNSKMGFPYLPLVSKSWSRPYLEGIMNNFYPDSLSKREQLKKVLMQPLLSEISQLKDWDHFQKIMVPPYLKMMALNASGRDVFSSLIQKIILERSLSSKEIFDIIRGVLFTPSDLREFFRLSLSYSSGKTFMNKLIRNFLDQKGVDFNEKRELLKKSLDLPEMKEEFKEVIYNSILQSSLSEEEKKACVSWEEIFASAPIAKPI